MAAVAGTQTVNITVNDIPLEVPKGEMIVESVKRLGLEIPIFCYHPRMKPVGMCRMCLVEVGTKMPDGTIRKMPKPQTACSLPATEGLVVYTDTAMVHNDRKGVLEFLLINHPLDCPICDRGGECPLQNNTLFYGPSTSRFVEMKRHAPKAFPLSKYVTLDLERCIQCGRCVRFTEEISGDGQLAFRFRGARMQPSTFELRDFESKFSGNTIEICPVGALTSAKYRFRARPWDLQTRPAVCTLCSNGCNVYLDYRAEQVARVNGRTNEAVNEEWTCDRGKFGHYDLYNNDHRLKSVLVREGDRLVPSEYPEAYARILGAFTQAGGAVAALAGGSLSNEDYDSLARLFRGSFGSEKVDHRWERHLPAAENRLERKLGTETVQDRIADFEDKKSIFVFGTSLADELPIVYLRVRKAWFKYGAKVVAATSTATEVDAFAEQSVRFAPGSEAVLLRGVLALLAKEGKVGGDYAAFTPERVAAETGVSESELRALATQVAGAAIIATRGLWNLPDGNDVAELLATLAQATGGSFNLYARQANEEGASLVGFLPANGGDTHRILQEAAEGQLRALWLVGVDPFAAHPDRELVTRALESVDFLVVQDARETEATGFASVVLPMPLPAETDGSYTNLERRVQRIRPVLPPKGEAKPAWKVAEEISLRMRPRAPLFQASDVLARIAADVPAFAGVSYDGLIGEGFVLGVGPDASAQPLAAPQVQG